jgi:membrane protein DedA with SNARE-associated domain
VVVASLSSSITSAIGNHGLYAVFALMLIDAVFPAASELVMVYAGAVASGAFASQQVVLFGWHVPHGVSAFVAMSLAGTVGYLIGSWIGWAIGRYGGRPFLERRGRWLHLSNEKLDRADAWFERHGSRAVLLGRITPVIRSFISIPAGVARMELTPYTLLTLPGSALWCFALAGVGWALGTSYETFHNDFRFVDYAVAAAVLAVAALLLLRWRRSRSTTIEGHASDTPG